MSSIRVVATVGEDGRVTLDLPAEMAGRDVEVQVRSPDDAAPSTVTRHRRIADRKQRRQLEVFADLMKSGALYRHDIGLALRAITEAASQVLDIDRVSVWLYDNKQSAIECRDLFDRVAQSHTSGMSLKAEDYPLYFAAIEQDLPIVANNAHADNRTSEFSAGYLQELGIGAMLDVPIRFEGQTIGVLCHEHIGEERFFSLEDQSSASYAAQLVSLALEIADRRRADRALGMTNSLLSATLEASEEGILAVNRERQLVCFNTRFLEMWGMPDAIIGTTTPGERLRFLANQTVDPQEYIRRAEQLFNSPNAEGTDILELKDGRIFERNSKPQWMGDELIGRVWTYRDITDECRAKEEAKRERDKAERLLLNILPAAIASRLVEGESTIADSYGEVTVLFADIVGFTSLATKVSPDELVGMLNELFSELDRLADSLGVEKIKTIGDSYMAAAGVPMPREDHATAVADLSLAMLECVRSYSRKKGIPLDLRIGIHSGPVIAGVIGIKRLIYDLWGDTVNIASRMESHGVASGIQITQATRDHLGSAFRVEDRGPQDIKGKGNMKTFLLLGKKA